METKNKKAKKKQQRIQTREEFGMEFSGDLNAAKLYDALLGKQKK